MCQSVIVVILSVDLSVALSTSVLSNHFILNLEIGDILRGIHLIPTAAKVSVN